MDDSLDLLGTAKYFSMLELASGYWQVGLTDSAQEKSAFCTAEGSTTSMSCPLDWPMHPPPSNT